MNNYLENNNEKPNDKTGNKTNNKTDKNNDTQLKPNEILIPVSIVIVLTIILAFFIYSYLPLDERRAGLLAIISIGITITAFMPQLIINYIKKQDATDNVLAIFLILAGVGVLLRLPAQRQALGYARGKKKGIYLNILISMVSLIPLIAHIVWQWQAAIYDSKNALIAKNILIVGAPLTTIISFALIIWLFTVKPIK